MIPCALVPHPFHPTHLLRRLELVIITKTMNLTAKARYLLHSTSGFCFFFPFFFLSPFEDFAGGYENEDFLKQSLCLCKCVGGSGGIG